MKVVFMGTPDFALYALDALVMSDKHDVLAVVTQPDRPGNRGATTPPPVKRYAVERGIPVHQFEKIRNGGADVLKGYGADVFVTAAYGQILSSEILRIPPMGVVNVHASLLPAYRGSSPIQWALINGEKTTGVTIMQTDVGLDTGNILLQKVITVEACDTAESLFYKLGKLGADALLEFFDKKERGEIVSLIQDEARATHYPMLKKSDGKIDWQKSADAVMDLIRGVTPWPGAFFRRRGHIVKVHSAVISSEFAGRAGEVLKADKGGLIVACGSGAISLKSLQTEGKKRMEYLDFLNGSAVFVGETFE